MMLLTSAVELRDYNKIFTGTNQSGGYDTPFLGFCADTKEITLLQDTTTFFHYPSTAPIVSLSSTDLIESGAFNGDIPYRADRIYKKVADYAKFFHWGNASDNLQSGIWLCSWLSGSNLETRPIWMDRYYSPGQIDETTALYVMNSAVVFDTPSTITFDPGVWYKYDHMGNETNYNIVNSLSSLSSLRLYINDWNIEILDQSPYNNSVKYNNFDTLMFASGVNSFDYPNDAAIMLNGIDQSVEVLFSSSYDCFDKLSLNIWARSSNWTEAQGNYIVGNCFRGGYGIKYNNGFFNPYFTIADISGNIILCNVNGNVIIDRNLPGTSAPVAVVMDHESYTWIVDNGLYENKKHLYKLDIDGNITTFVEFSNSVNLADAVIDKNNILWVLDSTSTQISGINSEGVVVSTQIFPSFATKLFIDNNNIKTGGLVTNGFYDNDNNLYYTGSGQYINSKTLNCDRRGNIWSIENNNTFYKYTSSLEFSLSGQLTDDLVYPSLTSSSLFFTNEYSNNTYSDFTWILQPSMGYLYKFDDQGSLIKKINTTRFKNSITTECVVKNDSSSYTWNRQFNYLPNHQKPNITANIYLANSVIATDTQKYTLSVPVSTLSDNDWHMFTMTFSNSSFNFFVDTILKETLTVPNNSTIFYQYNNALLIGGDVGRVIPLDTELNYTNNLYFNGKVDELRIYNKFLNNSDIKHLYLSKYKFKDLKWNMPTGMRNLVEEIVQFFKFKMPGEKSQYFNIKLIGLNITDEYTRTLVEDSIKLVIKKIVPAYAELYKIIWD